MFSTKTAALLSTCSVGIGILIGRKSGANTLDVNLKEESLNGNSKATYVFPTAHAKSIVPNKTKTLSLTSDSDERKIEIDANISASVSSVGELVKYGIPSLENVRTYDDFILSYDKRNRTANWVLEHLTPDKIDMKKTDRSNMKFVEDESFHPFHRATNKDFQGSGYDRGHLAAAANHRHSPTAMSQTFLLSNVSPQVGEGFNRDAWNNLEKYTRAVARKNKNVYVCTGPLYLPRMESNGRLYVKYEVIGTNHVAVPTHFFKVLLIESENEEKEIQSFVMPNEPLSSVKLKHYLIPIDTIERAAGIHFFDKIPKSSFKKINAVITGS